MRLSKLLEPVLQRKGFLVRGARDKSGRSISRSRNSGSGCGRTRGGALRLAGSRPPTMAVNCSTMFFKVSDCVVSSSAAAALSRRRRRFSA